MLRMMWSMIVEWWARCRHPAAQEIGREDWGAQIEYHCPDCGDYFTRKDPCVWP